MDIQVGDKITVKIKGNIEVLSEIIKDTSVLKTIKMMIEAKELEILKIERPKYELIQSNGEDIVENEIIYEQKKIINRRRKRVFKAIYKIN